MVHLLCLAYLLQATFFAEAEELDRGNPFHPSRCHQTCNSTQPEGSDATVGLTIIDVRKYISSETEIIRCGKGQKTHTTVTTPPVLTNTNSPSMVVSTDPPTPEEACVRRGGRTFRGSCYIYKNEKVKWKTAVKLCKEGKMHLVEISGKKENDFLISFLRGKEKKKIWIGLSDTRREGTWVWEWSGKRLGFSNWNKGSPDGRKKRIEVYKLEEDCVEINVVGKFKWNDRQCSVKSRFVCERRNEQP